MKLRRPLLSEQQLLLLLSFLIAVTSWYYVVSTRPPRGPQVTSKVVAVIPRIEGEPAYGYSMLGVRVTPPTVVVTGVAEQLAALDAVRTEAVDVTGATRDVVREVAVDAPSGMARPARVRVAVQVVPAIAARVVPGVRVRVQNVPPGVVARVEPSTIAVQVQGPVAVVSRLRPDDLVAVVDGADLSEGRRRVRPQVVAPEQVTVVDLRPDMVVVVVRRGG
ncbi:MAG: CdaR family protein [Armatimonadota bacterium]|nr:CdaR family protein [Armatimonadota bacterium]MDR7402340.1 CdaR family protein [Armatimonadota bacterium]MDR7404285.1 CdaR family protein [Armatimonadota bacterium]MDR7437325.1 CdaR family protein [Armatimonadota bacterium]MDR7472664.1 CdaR family protein [Armatimonadota bacterium]